MKIKLVGVRNLNTDEIIEPQRDYGIMLIAALDGKYVPESHEQEQGEPTFYLRVDRIDSIMDLKESKQIEFQHGQTPSQKMRWRIEEKLGKEEYENMIGYLMGRMDELTDDYLETLKTPL
jgi:hypothetical protein